MRYAAAFFLLLCSVLLEAEALKVVADNFEADEKSGVSIFSGHVSISKGRDEMNASRVTIHIDAERHPTEYTAEGDVHFFITAEANATYRGKAQKAVFKPDEQEYRFYGDVELMQLDQKKKIVGNEVLVNIKKGTAVAQGKTDKPVIMIFELEEKQ